MPLLSVFEWLNGLRSSTFLRESTNAFAILLTTHVVSMCLFMGLIIMMDLRLVGIGNLGTRVSRIQQRLFPWQMLGLAVSSTTGFLLFYSKPLFYYGKVFLWIKMAAMALAGVNALAFHLITYRSVAAWDRDEVTPAGARLAGGVSLALWAGVLVFGRLVAYEWLTYNFE